MKKLLALAITPLFVVIIFVLHMPSVEAWLSEKYEHVDLWIIGGFIVLSLLNHWITVVSPLRKYERLNKQKWHLLNLLVTLRMQQYIQDGFSFNLMIPKMKLYQTLEPVDGKYRRNGKQRRKLKLFSKVFKFEWMSSNCTISNTFRLSINQGKASECFETGMHFVHNFTNNEKFSLNDEQLLLTKDLKLIVCVPVKEEDESYFDHETGKVLGVFSADNSSLGADKYYNNETLRKQIINDLRALAVVCSKII